MTEPEELDEDLFADLYDGDEQNTKQASQPQPAPLPDRVEEPIAAEPGPPQKDVKFDDLLKVEPETLNQDQHIYSNGQNGTSVWADSQGNEAHENNYGDGAVEEESRGIGIKEDGKMFIGGLNWETTDQSLKEYFSKFGEVQECTVMRDGASGRSRGFGFLTFKDPRTVNVVMVKEHYLDGKIIDPKRAIPRDEQERTSKIFVGGVSQDANEQDFKEYFTQFGRVVDATLMIDKDTGRPRGFGFVTFDSEAAVDATLQGDLQILGKPIEVKKAQPRGNMREEEEGPNRRGGRRGGKENDRFRDNDRGTFENNSNNSTNANNQNQAQNQQGAQGMYGSGMTPQMMAQYWQKMQQYFATMQQQMATAAAVQNGGMAGQMGMAGLNPAMLQQMQAMQQVKQLQLQQQMARQQGSQSPLPQSPGTQAMAGMNPAMMQQMQQMHQLQMQQQQAQSAGAFGAQVQATPQMNNSPGGGGAGMGNYGGRRGTPGYNAQDQLLFEQQKYEQQQARRAAQEAQQMQSYQQGGPTSWEGMYDDVPQPNLGGSQAGMGRGSQGGFGGQSTGGNSKGGQQPNRGSQGPQSAPPANAPTGPKNAGKPGANYRGGGRGAHRGFHPYARN